MPIVKCAASKATPAKGIKYIMDPKKVIATGSQGFASQDPEKMARQMMQTMKLFRKGNDPEERKYYHAKVSFDPADRPENGGSLDAGKANRFAAEYARKTWPGREVVWAVQDHGASIHIHFIVAACDQATGKKLDARDEEYRAWKDQAQELAQEYGLSTLDWRDATQKKRSRELDPTEPVTLTMAETGLRERGQIVWKDDLRSIIDEALSFCCSMDELRHHLQMNDVELTRCSEQTISFKLGDHRACRGDTLGGDYTAAAIRSALERNGRETVPELVPEQGKEKAGIDAIIGNASRRQEMQATGSRPISQEERDLFRAFGREAGIKRSEIDEMCDQAEKATWTEKKDAWAKYSETKELFWAEWAVRQEALKKETDAAYKRLRKIRAAEWAIDPRNRRKSLLSVAYALIVLNHGQSRWMVENEIKMLKMAKQDLRQQMAEFKSDTAAARETLREKGLSLDTYMANVRRMQETADEIAKKNGIMLDAAERAKIEQTVAKKKARAARSDR